MRNHSFLHPCRGRSASADRIAVQGVTDDVLESAAQRMEGFSGRELAKFMASVQVGAGD